MVISGADAGIIGGTMRVFLWGLVCFLIGLNVGVRRVQDPPILGFRPIVQTQLRSDGVGLTLLAPDDSLFADGTPFQIWLETPAGLQAKKSQTRAGKTQEIFFPYRRAGLLLYRIRVAEFELSGRLQRFSQAPVNPLELNVGARAVRLDTRRPPALVMHPLDALGNVSDDPILVTTQTPDGKRQQKRIRSRHLLAFMWLPVGERPGLLSVSAQATNAFAERAEVDILAGATTSGRLSVQSNTTGDLTRDPVALGVGNLQDQFGNPATDGSAAEFSSRSALGWNLFVVRPVVRATASARVPWQDSSQVTARIEALRSPATTVPVWKPNWKIWFKGGVLYSNRIQDQIGAFFDDGSRLQVELIGNQDRHDFQVALQDGKLVWRIPQFAGLQKIRVWFLGQSQTIDLR
ncbi:MAG: hypothetical protein EAZ89_20460 [Bacteroidetes bacterium]|nr:MAG: hypothetical protein EAZ89_20460 [Bacteroidota bacterium]